MGCSMPNSSGNTCLHIRMPHFTLRTLPTRAFLSKRAASLQTLERSRLLRQNEGGERATRGNAPSERNRIICGSVGLQRVDVLHQRANSLQASGSPNSTSSRSSISQISSAISERIDTEFVQTLRFQRPFPARYRGFRSGFPSENQ